MFETFLRWIRQLQKKAHYAVWMSLLAIVILSLVPGEARPHTGAPGEFEHFLAYLGAGLFIAARYQLLMMRLVYWAGTAMLSGLLEVLQRFVPGRDPDPFDALASSSGLTVGLLIGGAAIAVARGLRSSLVQAE